MKINSYYATVLSNNLLLLLGVLTTFLIFDDNFILEEGDGGSSVIVYSSQLIIEFVILLVISTLFFYILILKFRESGMRYLYSITLISIGVFYISELTSLVWNTSSTVPKVVLVSLLIATSILLLIFYYVFALGLYRIRIRNMGIIFSSIIGGRIIGLYLDVTSLLVISIILIIYDTWNVFRGPLSKLIGKPTKSSHTDGPEIDDAQMKFQIKKIIKQGTPVLISRNTMIGIGDLFIFSILMYRGVIEWSFTGLFLVFIALNLGGLLTSYLLKKYSPLPGLPIPLFLVIITYSILNFII